MRLTSIFFYHSFYRKDQLTVLTLKFGVRDFTDPDPADPHWVFVVVSVPFKINEYVVTS